MSDLEKIQAIRAKCVELCGIYDNAEPHQKLPAYAGWRSTIAAIDWSLSTTFTANAQFVQKEIIAAWEGLV